MRKRVFGAVAFLLFPSWVWAVTVTLQWQPVAGATQYTVYQSVDQGTTWTTATTATTNNASIDAPETGLVLFRVSAKNDVGETINFDRGAWFDAKWSRIPGKLAVQ